MILVTGPTGTIGSHVVSELARAHVPARALVRTPDKGAGLPDGIDCLEAMRHEVNPAGK